jgi:hypothetical protein
VIKLEKYSATDGELRKFAAILATVIAILAAWFYWRTNSVPTWNTPVLSLLLIPAAFKPRLLAPFYSLWMNLGHGLGWLNTRIILAVMFYLVLSPVGLLRRLFGNDGLQLSKKTSGKTCAVKLKQRSSKHFDWLF